LIKTPVASTASSNTGHYNNSEVDALIEELNAEPDTAKRDQICKQIQQHMIDDQHWIVFAHKKLWTVFNNRVSGFVQSPCQYYFTTNEIDITA
jgi:peptide/nickel transport system substrate-binding protein